MAYLIIDRRAELAIRQDGGLVTKDFVVTRQADVPQFYELEEAVVLDVVMDENHPEVKNSKTTVEYTPKNRDGSIPKEDDNDYGNIGKVKFRFINSQRNLEKENLFWAYPYENTGLTEWPLMNEVVIVGKYLGRYYYTKKLNTRFLVNSNAIFSTERAAGKVDQNLNEYTKEPYVGPTSKVAATPEDSRDIYGVLGSYFKFNPFIRTLKRFEGDTILESRFGSSIRFGAYDYNRDIYDGVGDYSDGGGNPMILIRNRQAHVKLPQGKTAKGYTIEDINNDGSSIHMTSGKTVSSFQPTVGTPLISGRKPVGFPEFSGDQIIINSDRLVFSARSKEMLFMSKKRIGMITDDPFSVTSGGMMTLTSMKSATLSAPQVFLGDHGKIYEPALLGRTTSLWMYKLIDWMLSSLNGQIEMTIHLISHFHISLVGPTTPAIPASFFWLEHLQSLIASQVLLLGIRSQISANLSSRVFVAGGVD